MPFKRCFVEHLKRDDFELNATYTGAMKNFARGWRTKNSFEAPLHQVPFWNKSADTAKLAALYRELAKVRSHLRVAVYVPWYDGVWYGGTLSADLAPFGKMQPGVSCDDPRANLDSFRFTFADGTITDMLLPYITTMLVVFADRCALSFAADGTAYCASTNVKMVALLTSPPTKEDVQADRDQAARLRASLELDYSANE